MKCGRRKYIWPCLVTAETHTPDGKRHRIHRMVEGAGDLKAAMNRAVAGQRRPGIWYGVEVSALTPLGQHESIVFEPMA